MVAAANAQAVRSIQLSSKGQVVIPKEVRERLGWKAGDTLTVEETDDAIIVRIQRNESAEQKAALFGPPVSMAQLIGCASHLRRGNPPMSIAEMTAVAHEAAAAPEAKASGRRVLAKVAVGHRGGRRAGA